MRLAQARLEHRNRRLVRVQHAPAEQVLAHGLHERCQLHADGTDPLGLRRARDRITGSTQDLFLSVERLMVDVLGHRHMSHQPGCRQPLVDDVSRHWCLDERAALGAGPLATNVPLHSERARRVVELLGHVFADALEFAAAVARRVLGLVAHLAPWQVGRQCLPLRLALVGAVLGRHEPRDLARKGFQVLVDRFLEQALLFGAKALAGSRELEPLEYRHLVRQLVDDGLLERNGAFMAGNEFGLGGDLRLCGAKRLAQLLRLQCVDVVVGDHGG